jgi:hypothetical protein
VRCSRTSVYLACGLSESGSDESCGLCEPERRRGTGPELRSWAWEVQHVGGARWRRSRVPRRPCILSDSRRCAAVIPTTGSRECSKAPHGRFPTSLARAARPRRCAAEQSDELAWLPLWPPEPGEPKPITFGGGGLCITANLATNDRDGSNASLRHATDTHPMSALVRKRPDWYVTAKCRFVPHNRT